MSRAKGILESIGNTPLLDLSHLTGNPKVKWFVKLEGNNPGGSVKDRAALNMIQSAMDRGEIQKGDRLVEATSGNTGIALALIASQLGVKMTLVMPENSTEERVKTMRAFGAKVILTSADKGIEGSRDFALKMSEEEGCKILNQFANDDNWKAHFKTTGPEIWKGTKGKVTHFVSAMGTTGTIMGTSTFLKGKEKKIQIVGVQPTENAKIPGIRRWPKEYLPEIFDPKKVDQIIDVSEEEARNQSRELAQKAGLFVGMSSGGAAFAALKLAKELKKGVIVSIACDRGDRYLSSDLFAD
ncbi:MAG: cysteine synthase CysM [Crocinitomicaceae bacterium]|nr:cysteine synthase CysM [Crocinitomicaceae bacterium]